MTEHSGDISEQEKAKLEEEMREKALEQLSDRKDIVEYLDATLRNFSYRYLENEGTGRLTPAWMIEEGNPSGRIEIVSYESQLAESLKTKNPITRKGIISMASQFKKTEQPKVRYTLGVSWDSLDRSDVQFCAYAEVNWGFPEYPKERANCHRREEKLSYSDALEMRNNFPRQLEEVCAIL